MRSTPPARAIVAALPVALRRLRLRAGYPSLRPAAEAIAHATGQTVSRATLSKWEYGTCPRADHLVTFLAGLGFTFRDLQDAIEETMVEEDDPAAAALEQLRRDPGLRGRLRTFLENEPGSIAAADILDYLDEIEGRDQERPPNAQ
ncbi:MAG TPA: helix-turn-helix transcriptional regulator [Thermoanaerobaculia bacterium]|jgi:transcriptional regulator with XRE-family HTH domain